MSNPRLLMLDEPSLGVAPLVVRDLQGIVCPETRRADDPRRGSTECRAALAFADRGYCIETGQIILSGTSEELSSSRDVQCAYPGDYQRIEE